MTPRKKLLIWILILIVLALLGFLIYWLFFKEETTEKGTPEAATPTPTTGTVTGEFTRGEVPEGWTIVEYKNGAGSDMLVSGVTYTGLTGLEVKNPDGTVVFKLEGVYGIGGLDSCQNYYQFSDDSAAYLAGVQATNTEVGEPAPTIVDLTAAAYQDFELFGIPVRRISTAIYWDVTAGDAYFQAACGIRARIFNFTNPAFSGDGTSINSYQFTINTTSPESDLLELDTILNSLTAD